ncbi:hypothetical protein HYPSUDRAFT_203652, partial [Hypholoma sublateritium FD-334 SS-4]
MSPLHITFAMLYEISFMDDPVGEEERRTGTKDADGPRSARTVRKKKQQVVKVGDMDVARGTDGMFPCGLCLKKYESAYSLQRHYADTHNMRTVSATASSSLIPRTSAPRSHTPARLFIAPRIPSERSSPSPSESGSPNVPATRIPRPISRLPSRSETKPPPSIVAAALHLPARDFHMASPLVMHPMGRPLTTPSLEPRRKAHVDTQTHPQFNRTSDDDMMITPPRTSPQPAMPRKPDEIDVALYDITPDEGTVIHDSGYNFPAIGIIINTVFKVVICMECGEALDPVSICAHTRQHNPHNRPMPTIVEDLRERYGIVAPNELSYATQKVYPVFGIPIEPNLLHFCGKCHRGYNSVDSLRGHQSSGSRCEVPFAQRSSYLSYGQKLTKEWALNIRGRTSPVAAPSPHPWPPSSAAALFRGLPPPWPPTPVASPLRGRPHPWPPPLVASHEPWPPHGPSLPHGPWPPPPVASHEPWPLPSKVCRCSLSVAASDPWPAPSPWPRPQHMGAPCMYALRDPWPPPHSSPTISSPPSRSTTTLTQLTAATLFVVVAGAAALDVIAAARVPTSLSPPTSALPPLTLLPALAVVIPAAAVCPALLNVAAHAPAPAVFPPLRRLSPPPVPPSLPHSTTMTSPVPPRCPPLHRPLTERARRQRPSRRCHPRRQRRPSR